MVPADAAVSASYRYVARASAGCRRILEVGCGSGRLAARLARAGLEVTAIDRELAALEVRSAPGLSFVETDFLSFEGGPFDALVLVASMHHIRPLSAVMARMLELLAPSGRVVIDDFDVEAPDEATVGWYYRRQEELAEKGLYEPERICTGEKPLLRRWRSEHDEDPALHTGDEMLSALRSSFVHIDVRRGPYLYRYICGGVAATPEGIAAAARLVRDERSGVRSGALRAVGLRAVAWRTH